MASGEEESCKQQGDWSAKAKASMAQEVAMLEKRIIENFGVQLSAAKALHDTQLAAATTRIGKLVLGFRV